MRRQKCRAALKAGELGPATATNGDIGQSCREWTDIQALNAQRCRCIVAVVGLERKRIGACVSGTKLIDQIGIEDMRFVQCQALRPEVDVLNAGNVRSQVELRGGRGWGWETT